MPPPPLNEDRRRKNTLKQSNRVNGRKKRTKGENKLKKHSFESWRKRFSSESDQGRECNFKWKKTTQQMFATVSRFVSSKICSDSREKVERIENKGHFLFLF